MAKVAYLRHRNTLLPSDIEIIHNREIKIVYKDRDKNRKELNDMLQHCSEGDKIILSTVYDIGASTNLLSLIRRLEKKSVTISSISEKWFSTEKTSKTRDAIIGMAGMPARRKL